MAKLIRRLLGLLFTLGIYDKHYKVIWDVEESGEVLSGNKFYAGFNSKTTKTGKFIPAGAIRAAIKNDYAKRFTKLFAKSELGVLHEFSLVVFYKSRHDCDNISTMAKVMIDTMKGKYISNDGNKIYKSIHIIRDDSVKQGTIHFHLIGK